MQPPRLAGRPKLLLLAYHFPPWQEVASVRTGSIARNLFDQGWDVSVVTLDPRYVQGPIDTDHATEWDHPAIRRINTGHAWRFLSPNLKSAQRGVRGAVGKLCARLATGLGVSRTAGWLRPARRACAHLTAADVDVILATGAPWEAFQLADELATRFHRPFVLDYRDLWTGQPHAGRERSSRAQRKEARLLASCSAVTVVSPSMATFMSERFGVAAKTSVVPNGFDPRGLDGVTPTDFGHFAVVYAGDFYPPIRDVAPIMRALQQLDESRHHGSWRFHYYGPATEHVRLAAAAHGVQERVVIHGLVRRSEVLSAVRGAGVAIVITSVYPTATLGEKGILTGKLYEIMGLGTPVLAVAPPGSDIETVLATGGGGQTFCGTDIAGMTSYLDSLIDGYVPEIGHPEEYSWPNIIQQLDSVLRQVVELDNHP
jgi:glycosyltransferase involved in cell wall biosynthesis